MEPPFPRPTSMECRSLGLTKFLSFLFPCKLFFLRFPSSNPSPALLTGFLVESPPLRREYSFLRVHQFFPFLPQVLDDTLPNLPPVGSTKTPPRPPPPPHKPQVPPDVSTPFLLQEPRLFQPGTLASTFTDRMSTLFFQTSNSNPPHPGYPFFFGPSFVSGLAFLLSAQFPVADTPIQRALSHQRAR